MVSFFLCPLKICSIFTIKNTSKIAKVTTHNFKKGKINMIFRTNKITNYTKIDNRYLEDKSISLKAKGLLTLMLSLPNDWKFNINGLCLLCKESKNAVNSAIIGVKDILKDNIENVIKELKDNKYLEVEKTYDESGRFIYEYIIYEYPDNPTGNLDLP